MDNIILDIETDGLLDTVTKVHCIVMKTYTKLYDTHALASVEVAITEEQIKNAIQKIKLSHIIGHNVLGFDLEVLRKLYGLRLIARSQACCLLINSMYIFLQQFFTICTTIIVRQIMR